MKRETKTARGALWLIVAAAAAFAAAAVPAGCGGQAKPGNAGAGGAGGSSGGAGGTAPGAGGQAGGSTGGSGGGGATGTGGSGGSAAGSGGAGGGAGGAGGTGGADAGATGGTGGTGAAGGTGGGATDGGSPDGPTGLAVIETLDLVDVWSGHPVAFSLITRGNQQFAAYFDADRNMTVSSRTLGTTNWTTARLATVLGWDSHNYVTMAIDDDGFIHVSGNMHGVPLIYFRTTRALDVTSFARVTAMVGTNEAACTYPQFLRGPNGELIYAYRDGSSGNGNYIFDTYTLATKTWTRLLNTPLLDGQGTYSAYPVGPLRGPDGWYHIVWVWRDTPDAATNHDISYAKSRDLVSWQTVNGTALPLPIRFGTTAVVDPVPAGGGMINNNTKIGFDAQNRAIVAYHKYDAAGNTQLYNARFENGAWARHQTSMWSYRWAFGGQGTLVFDIEVEEAKLQPGGALTQEWYHARNGGWGAFRLDPTTLAAAATIPPPRPYPAALDQPQSTTAGMVARWAQDAGAGPTANVLYMLRWETLESNRDMPRATIPPPTRLRLYGIRQAP